MRHLFRKITAMMLAVATAVMFAACGSAEKPADQPEKPAETQTEATTAAETAKETDAEVSTEAETQPETAAQKEVPVSVLQLIEKQTQYQARQSDTYQTKYRIECDVIELAEESAEQYPKLGFALEEFNKQVLASAEEERPNIEESADSFFEAFPPSGDGYDSYLYEGSTPYILRADSNVLSILYYYDSFLGGAHPNRAYDGVNFRPETGELLKLTDVVTDLDAFALKVDEKLKEKYPEEYPNFFTDPVQAVKDSATQEGIMAWTLGYEGMTVYFSPYNLGAYAMGEQIVTVYYDEAPQLFEEEFTKSAESYIIPFVEMVPTEVDAAGSGSREEIRVETISTDEYSGCDFAVHRGGGQVRLDTYGYGEKSYLVKENGQYYVYVFVTSDNDYVSLYTIDLKTLSLHGEKYGMSASKASLGYSYEDSDSASFYTVKELALTDPASFRLDSHIDFLSTMSGSRRYHTGEDGCPVADEEAMTVKNTRVLKVLQPVTVDTVDENGNVTGSANLAAGTLLFFIRTDGKTYADMQEVDESLVSGEETEWYSDYRTEEVQMPDWSKPVYRIREDRSEWPGKVNGIEEDKVFAGTMYAG